MSVCGCVLESQWWCAICGAALVLAHFSSGWKMAGFASKKALAEFTQEASEAFAYHDRCASQPCFLASHRERCSQKCVRSFRIQLCLHAFLQLADVPFPQQLNAGQTSRSLRNSQGAPTSCHALQSIVRMSCTCNVSNCGYTHTQMQWQDDKNNRRLV